MPRPDWPATIMDFQERFATEAACLDYLAASRWPEGFACPGCGGRRAWVLERRHLWECAECHLQTSVTAGTVMHGTRTPLRGWFSAAYLVATHHSGISAKNSSASSASHATRPPGSSCRSCAERWWPRSG